MLRNVSTSISFWSVISRFIIHTIPWNIKLSPWQSYQSAALYDCNGHGDCSSKETFHFERSKTTFHQMTFFFFFYLILRTLFCPTIFNSDFLAACSKCLDASTLMRVGAHRVRTSYVRPFHTIANRYLVVEVQNLHDRIGAEIPSEISSRGFLLPRPHSVFLRQSIYPDKTVTIQ